MLNVLCCSFESKLIRTQKIQISGKISHDWLCDTFASRSQVDRVYLSSPNAIAILDHEKKRTYVIRKDGLPDTGKAEVIKQIQK